MLAVEKELRGQRIGSKLVKLCLDRMRLSGCTSCAFGARALGLQLCARGLT